MLHKFSASTARFIFETFPTTSDGTYGIDNMTFDIDINKEGEEMHVKTEKVIDSGEEKCMDIKEEEGLHSEEEEEDIEIKEEVRMRIRCKILRNKE